MTPKDRSEIYEKFKVFSSYFGKKEQIGLEKVVDLEVSAFFSITNKLKDGSQASIFGVRDFFESFPKTDCFITNIYRYTCLPKKTRENSYGEIEDYAVQYAQLMCSAEKENQSYGFVIQFFGEWKCSEYGWRIKRLKMDIMKGMGDLEKLFEGKWIFPQESALERDKGQLPCIRGDFDCPWELADEEIIKNEKEAVQDVIQRFLFGIDHFKFEYCYETTLSCFEAEDLFGIPGKYQKNEWISRAKFKRQADRYCVHPCCYTDIQISEDTAVVKISHMQFLKQSNGRMIFKGLESETDAYQVILKNRNGWKIASWRKEMEGE